MTSFKLPGRILKAALAALTGSCLVIPQSPEATEVLPQSRLPEGAATRHTQTQSLMGAPGTMARYHIIQENDLPGSVVKRYVLTLGPGVVTDTSRAQWLRLEATKVNGEQFQLWLLTAGYPPPTLEAARQTTARYILTESHSPPVEFQHAFTGEAVLPSLGGWRHLIPRAAGIDDTNAPLAVFPERTDYLGHSYRLDSRDAMSVPPEPPNARLVKLRPDVLVGVPHNTRQKDETRRYDDSDYELVRLTRDDYREMSEAGINCVRVDVQQLPWVEDLDVFYWGLGANELPYPECLYRSRYLGPSLFLDEPAVCTRDYVIRPRLRDDPGFRESIRPQAAYAAFQEFFHQKSLEEAPNRLIRDLSTRPDADLGAMTFPQENLYSWETMVSSAAYQLSQHPQVPSAMVFEPPGRVGTLRTVPELNMTYGCQLQADAPNHLTAIIFGFLRGGARLTGKEWGTSVYGSVDRADAFWLMTHAYDLGATRFFFWDSHRLACVPYQECLALARSLKMRAENRPHRDLSHLKRAAEVVILLPPGYNLGHVYLGKGNLWGLGELNLERVNSAGVKYRVVMANFFTEIERCLRLGVAFDLLWDLPNLEPSGYRESVRIREDGKVEVRRGDHRTLFDGARKPARPAGHPPELQVALSANEGRAPLHVAAKATVRENSAPVYYTFGTDTEGMYQNAMVAWELYGPGEEDHRWLIPPGLKPRVTRTGKHSEVEADFTLNRPGRYRLRAATVDLAGRTDVKWTSIVVTE